MFLLSGSFWDKLLFWDQSLFISINTGLQNPVFDVLMPFMRNSYHWIPLYIFLIAFVLINFRSRGLWWILFFLITVAATDMMGFYIKEWVQRVRPCNDPDMHDSVRLLLQHCGNGPSFISNHAANHFGMASFFYFSFRHISLNATRIGFAWAFLIAFSQVYVGVHYPLDIIAGALLGLGLGSITGRFFRNRFGIVIFDNQPVA